MNYYRLLLSLDGSAWRSLSQAAMDSSRPEFYESSRSKTALQQPQQLQHLTQDEHSRSAVHRSVEMPERESNTDRESRGMPLGSRCYLVSPLIYQSVPQRIFSEMDSYIKSASSSSSSLPEMKAGASSSEDPSRSPPSSSAVSLRSFHPFYHPSSSAQRLPSSSSHAEHPLVGAAHSPPFSTTTTTKHFTYQFSNPIPSSQTQPPPPHPPLPPSSNHQQQQHHHHHHPGGQNPFMNHLFHAPNAQNSLAHAHAHALTHAPNTSVVQADQQLEPHASQGAVSSLTAPYPTASEFFENFMFSSMSVNVHMSMNLAAGEMSNRMILGKVGEEEEEEKEEDEEEEDNDDVDGDDEDEDGDNGGKEEKEKR